MPGRSYRIARIAGIPVGVSPMWLVIVAVLTAGLGASYYPSRISGIAPAYAYALGLLSALLLFASILAHEFGHALVARRHGMTVQEIDLWLLGGVAQMRGRPRQPQDELRYAAAGPLVTLVISLLFVALALALPGSAPGTVRALVDYEAYINVMILGFNLLPAFPLDGGRVVRALLWRARGDLLRATETAAAIGSAFGWVLAMLGVFLLFAGDVGGLWLTMIGGFMVLASGAERVHEEQVQAVSGLSVGALMSSPPIVLRSEWTLADAVHQLEHHPHDAFPVIGHDGRAIGLLTTAELEQAIHGGYATLVRELTDSDPELLVQPTLDAGVLLDNFAFLRHHHAVVINRDGRPIGIVSDGDILRAIRIGQLRDARPDDRELLRHR